MLLKKTNNFICNKLNFGKLVSAGRNNLGRITIRHRGGGVQRIFRIVDFFHYIWDIKSILLSFEYDCNRSALLSLLSYSNAVITFTLAVHGGSISNTFMNTNTFINFESRVGYCANLNFIKPGIYINSVEFKPFTGSKYIRTAFNYAKLVSTAQDYTIVKLRSKVLLKLSNKCLSKVGVVEGKKIFLLQQTRNAGLNRRLGWRPSVRGVAMNPIDHPHGGGQGKTSGGRVSVTPWAKITKGLKTRRKINYGSFILKR